MPRHAAQAARACLPDPDRARSGRAGRPGGSGRGDDGAGRHRRGHRLPQRGRRTCRRPRPAARTEHGRSAGNADRRHGQAGRPRAERFLRYRPGHAVRRRRRDRRPAAHQQPRVLRPPDPPHDAGAVGSRCRWPGLSHRPAAAPRWRRRTAGLEPGRAGALSHRPGARVGALRLAQGQADAGAGVCRQQPGRPGAPARKPARAVRLPQVFRLRRPGGAARPARAHTPGLAAPRPGAQRRGQRQQHQAGRWRHPRDRVHRAVVAAHPRRPHAGAATPRPARSAARRARRRAGARGRRAEAGSRLSLPAPHRACPAIPRGRADPSAAGRPGPARSAGGGPGLRTGRLRAHAGRASRLRVADLPQRLPPGRHGRGGRQPRPRAHARQRTRHAPACRRPARYRGAPGRTDPARLSRARRGPAAPHRDAAGQPSRTQPARQQPAPARSAAAGGADGGDADQRAHGCRAAPVRPHRNHRAAQRLPGAAGRVPRYPGPRGAHGGGQPLGGPVPDPAPPVAGQPDRLAHAVRTAGLRPGRAPAGRRPRRLPAARRRARHRTADESDARRPAPGQLPAAGAGPRRRIDGGETGRPALGAGRPAAGRDHPPRLAAGQPAARRRAAPGRHRLRQAGRQGAGLRLRPGPGVPVRRRPRGRRRTLRQAGPAHDLVAIDHDVVGPPVRSRPAAAPRRQRRAAGRLAGGLRAIPALARLALGAPGAHTRALRRRRHRGRRALRAHPRRHPGHAARRAGAARRGARHARQDQRRAP
ncbi:Uncharacterised protein [Bordetella pertussis]|nr:Uncharacterised protein [Bordetella pertussis]CFL79839.1 Uncharacterised protein [Bordetella pertussis]CFL98738.1 Uncharacterised protein [Bordetella pertussis]CFM28350.1 Uncharacterised protein [Bordetella pertussis]CFM34510.1 Uncharacterised protein [Bordetella pertussis]